MGEEAEKGLTDSEIVTERSAERRSFLTRAGGLVLGTAAALFGRSPGSAQIRISDLKPDLKDIELADPKSATRRDYDQPKGDRTKKWDQD